ncbi:MAG: tetratricopeptide repeat protein [Isosphaeraceae bacterium]
MEAGRGQLPQSATGREFLERLTAAGLLSAERLEKARAANEEDPWRLARHLIEQGLLTTYQVEQLLAGEPHPLVVEQYVLLDLMGREGIARVFKARHRAMGRLVEIHVWQDSDVSDPEAARSTARGAGRVAHPNLQGAYDAGSARGLSYLAFEYLDVAGLDRARADEERLSTAQVLAAIRQAAEGLRAAHALGMVHGDVRPGRLVCLENGAVKLKGFARLREPSRRLDPALDVAGLVVTLEFLLLNSRNPEIARANVLRGLLARTSNVGPHGRPVALDEVVEALDALERAFAPITEPRFSLGWIGQSARHLAKIGVIGGLVLLGLGGWGLSRLLPLVLDRAGPGSTTALLKPAVVPERASSEGDSPLVFGKSREARQAAVRARESLQRGDWIVAIERLNVAIRLNPEDATLPKERGKCYARLEKWKEAAADLEDHSPALRDDAEARFLRGNARWQLHRWDEAAEDLEFCLENGTEGIADQVFRLVARMNPASPPEAVAAMTKRVEHGPGRWYPLILRAAARFNATDRDGARDDLVRSIRLGPKNWWNWRNLLDFCRMTDQYGILVDICDSLPMRGDDDPDIQLFKAEGYTRRFDVESAKRAIDRAIELRPAHAGSYYVRARLNAALHNTDAALADISKAIEIGPTPVMHLQRAILEADAGHVQPADDCLRAAQAAAGSYRIQDSTRVAILEATGRGDEASRVCRELLSKPLESNDPSGANGVAWACCLLNAADFEWTEVVKLARRAVALAPTEWAYTNTLGVALYRAGHFEESIESLNRSISLHRDDLDYSDAIFLALAHHRLNHEEEARAWFERAINHFEERVEVFMTDPHIYGFHRLQNSIFRRHAEQVRDSKLGP